MSLEASALLVGSQLGEGRHGRGKCTKAKEQCIRKSTCGRSDVWGICGQTYGPPQWGQAIWGWTAEEFTCCLSLIEVCPQDTNCQHFPGPGSGFWFCRGEKLHQQCPEPHLGAETEGGETSRSGAPGSGRPRSCGCPHGGLGEHVVPVPQGQRSGQDGRRCAPGAAVACPGRRCRPRVQGTPSTKHIWGDAFLGPPPNSASAGPLCCPLQ